MISGYLSCDSHVIPGNVLIDTLMKELYDVEFDKDGETVCHLMSN